MRSPALRALAVAAFAAGVGLAVSAAPGADRALAEMDAPLRSALGRVVFRRTWVSAPASTSSAHGLGPLYNARSCAECHPGAGRGQPRSDGSHGPRGALVLRLSVPPTSEVERLALAQRRANVVPEPIYGFQLQTSAIQGHRSEARLEISYAEFPRHLADGTIVHLRKPSLRIADLGYGPLRHDVMVSPRTAPPLHGLGLLEMVPEAQILEWQGKGPGGGGIANRVWSLEQGAVVLGRFGWKAGSPSVRQQVAEAFALDIGMSSSLYPQPSGDCSEQQALCRRAPGGGSARSGGHEVSDMLLDLVTDYVAGLAPPSRRAAAAGEVRDGEALFHAAGCPLCHRPSLRTGTSAGTAHLRDLEIWPYTDLLLHDMGEELADARPEGLAGGRMWRTAPLWGAGRAQTPDGRVTYLHDGRARSLEEAVHWHGGEADDARIAFERMTLGERQALVAFLRSL